MPATNFHWITADQIKIFAKDWSIDDPKAVICLVHGMGEHIERYDHFAEYFNRQGYAVVGKDQRGHGQSAGKRGHTPTIDAVLDELADLIVEAEVRYPDIPAFLYGHSMGGALVLYYALQRHPQIRGIISSAPWIELAFKPSSFLIGLGRIMKMIYPSFVQPSGLEIKYLSKDPMVVEKYENDPMVHNKISSSTGIGMIKVGYWLDHYTGKFPVPVLIMHGSEDKITSQPASQKFSQQIKGDVTYKVWENMYHEIHNEPEQDTVFNFIYNWIQQRL